jgi:hypothetical protein
MSNHSVHCGSTMRKQSQDDRPRVRVRYACFVALLAAVMCSFGWAQSPDSIPPGPERLKALVDANIIGVHAYQVMLARKQGNLDRECWPKEDPKESELEALVAHQSSLLSTPADAKRWALGAPSRFDPSKDLAPLLEAQLAISPKLPVSVFARYLHEQAPRFRDEEIRSIANLYQTVLEVERDGDRLQELYAFYITLGLPVYIGQLGLPGSDADLLATGRLLEGKACASPLGLRAAEWQIAGRKIWNWGEKNLHIRDAQVVADELLADPEVQPLLPKMRSLRPQRIAIIGHSFTMDLHWSSPSAFVPIVTAMFARENSSVQFRQFQGGGLTSSRARKNFYDDALAWHPDLVLLVLANRTDQDYADLRAMEEGFKAAGTRVIAFDDVHDPDSSDPEKLKRELQVEHEAGIEVANVSAILAAAPDRNRFSCLDHIHMTEPYHRLMAKQWLKVILGVPLPAASKRN